MGSNSTQPSEVTALLKAWRGGDESALERLTPLVYDHLRAQARRYVRYERQGLTLQGTALVHEAFLRLVEGQAVDWRDRSHFYAVASQVMRRILVDAARARAAASAAAVQPAPFAPMSTSRRFQPVAIGPPTTSAPSTTRSIRWRGSIRGARESSSCVTSAASASKRPLMSCASLRRA